MKATGVVRRIDELGRIVIPKEIRRTLRIRDGETMEIYVDRELVALKKYSPMDDLEDISKRFVEAIYQTLKQKQNIIVTDRDKVIAAAGNLKKKYLGKIISSYLEKVIEEREFVTQKDNAKLKLLGNDVEEEDASFVICPIIANGDSVGLVIILSYERGITEIEEKVAKITAQFLEKYIEE